MCERLMFSILFPKALSAIVFSTSESLGEKGRVTGVGLRGVGSTCSTHNNNRQAAQQGERQTIGE